MVGRGDGLRALTVIGIFAVGALAGCGGGSDDDGTTSTSSAQAFSPAAEAGALQEAGTEIAEGVHVQPGSALVGAAFPAVEPFDDRAAPSGWQAVVAVQGDPIEVWDAYASELGIDDVAGARKACIVDAAAERPDDATRHQRFLTEPALDGEVRLECSARIGDLTASLASGAVGCVRPDLSDDPCELRSGSALYLRRAPGGPRTTDDDLVLGTDALRLDRASAEQPQGEGALAERGAPATGEPTQSDPGDPSTTRQPPDPHPGPVDIPDGPIVPPELQRTGPSNLPGEGERIDDGIDDYLSTGGEAERPAILPKGAESLIAPAMLIDCNSGLVAAVEVPLPPAEAVAAFATDDPESATAVRSGEWSGRTWATRSFDSAGGYKLQLTAVTGREDGSSYVLGTECGD